MKKTAWTLVLLSLVACGGASEKESQSTPDTTSVAAEPVVIPVEMAVRNVTCGCAIDSIGVCGDYIDIDGQYVKIANWADLGLGAMEWCGKEGVTAESSGEFKDGRFFAATLVVHPAE